MNEERIEELLRTAPPDERTYALAPLPTVMTAPIARTTHTTKRPLAAATSLVVVAAIVVIGGALFGTAIGRYLGSPVPSGLPTQFEMTLTRPDPSHPVAVVLVDHTSLVEGFAPDLPAVAPGGPAGVQFETTPRIYGDGDPTAFAVFWMGGACVDRIDFDLTRSDAGLSLTMRATPDGSLMCRQIGIFRTVWLRLSQPIDISTIAINGREGLVLAPSASPDAATGPAPDPTISEQVLARERFLLAVFDALSVLPGFQVGGLDPDPNINGVFVYWNGDFGPAAQAIVENAKRQGISVTVLSVPYSYDELRVFASRLVTALQARGLQTKGFQIGDPFDEIRVYVAEPDISPATQRLVEEVGSEVLPSDLKASIVLWPGPAVPM